MANENIVNIIDEEEFEEMDAAVVEPEKKFWTNIVDGVKKRKVALAIGSAVLMSLGAVAYVITRLVKSDSGCEMIDYIPEVNADDFETLVEEVEA